MSFGVGARKHGKQASNHFVSRRSLRSASGHRNANSDNRANPFPRNAREGNLAAAAVSRLAEFGGLPIRESVVARAPL
jgi:hypothetical protein